MGITTEIGSRGEQAAAEYLCSHGFTLLRRNWRNGRYELDIVARKGNTIHFVEVKCRKQGSLTTPQQAITQAKFRSLSNAAAAYIAEYGLDMETQFDLVAVEHSYKAMEVKYIPNAMVHRW